MKTISLAFFLFAATLTATPLTVISEARTSETTASNGTFDRGVLRAWRFSNAAGADVIDGTLHLKGWWDPAITIPLTVKAEENYILKVTLKTSNTMSAMQIRWKADNRTKFYPNASIPLYSDGEMHTYTIDLRNNPNLFGSELWKGTITQLTIAFIGFSDDIAIEAVELIKPSGVIGVLGTALGDFATPIGVKQSSINIMESPYLFTLPFIFIANIVAIGALTCYIAFRSLRRRQPSKYSESTLYGILLITILIAWVTYDLRAIYNETFTVASINGGYIKAPTDNKRFYDMDNIYSFGKFVEETLPEGTGPVKIHTPRERAVYAPLMNYLLQSKTKAAGKEENSPPYHIVYKNPAVSTTGNTLYSAGRPIATGTVVKSFDDYSFIFMETSK